MYKYRLLHIIFADKKTRFDLDLILILLLCLDNLRKKKTHMYHGAYRKLQIGISFLVS